MEFETPELESPQNGIIEGEAPKSRGRKIAFSILLFFVFLTGFLVGVLYFLKSEIIVKYIIDKQNLPLEVDKIDIGITGNFEFERFRYDLKQNTDKIQIEYGKGDISLSKFLFSNSLDLDSKFTGVKVPIKDGVLSGGNWTVITDIQNLKKNTQQWSGPVELVLENVNLQYKVMETNYVALIKTGKIKGRLQNAMLNLDTTQIDSDIAKITIGGNISISYPYNVNIQLNITPTETFDKKYPDEAGMLKSFMKNQTEIAVSLTGPINRINPKVTNLNLPRF